MISFCCKAGRISCDKEFLKIVCNLFVFCEKNSVLDRYSVRPGPKVIKLFSCSTQLSMNFPARKC